VGITANILERALNPDLIVHDMKFNKNEPLLLDWRSIDQGDAGPLGKLESIGWMAKKAANFMNEFYGQHFPSFPNNDFPRYGEDRRAVTNLHEKLPMRVIGQLLEKLIVQRIGPYSGHFHLSKCLYLEHKLYLGKQHIHSQPFPKQKYNGCIIYLFL
jgi:hypothetical protein